MLKAFTSLAMLLLAAGALPAQNPLLDISRGVPAKEYVTTTRPAYQSLLRCLANARNQPCSISIFGDSQTRSDNTMARRTNGGAPLQLDIPYGYRWADILRKDLQRRYGSNGTGMISLRYALGSGDVDPDNFTITTSYNAGGWTADSTLGPYQVNGAGTITEAGMLHVASGNTITFTSDIPYDRVRIVGMTNSASSGWSVAIDGVSVGTAFATPTGSPQPQTWESMSVPLAVHRATFTCGTGSGGCYVYAIGGPAGTSGVSVNMYGVGSSSLEWQAHAPATQMALSDLVPHQLSILLDLTNEPGQGITPAAYNTSLGSFFAHENALGVSMLVLAPMQDAIANQAPYFPVLTAFSESHPTLAYIDFKDGVGTAQDNSLYGLDLLHPNIAGNRREADMVEADLFGAPLAELDRKGCPAGNSFGGFTRSGDAICNPTPYVPPPTCGIGYAYSIPLTIPHGVVFETSPNHPWLFSFNGATANSTTLAAWKSTAASGQIATANATDAILCSAASGGTQYPHEMVAGSWNATSGSAQIYAAVPVSTISDSTVYLFLGKANAPDTSRPSDLWDGYVFVDHFATDTTFGTDSTRYGNNVVGVGSGYGRGVGPYGPYATFTSNGYLVNVTPVGLPQNSDQRTVEGLFQLPASPAQTVPFGYGDYNRESNFSPVIAPSLNVILGETPGGNPDFPWVPDTSWHFLSMGLQDGTPTMAGVRFTLDGNPVATGCFSTCSADYKTEDSIIQINGVGNGGSFATVNVGEVRISSVYRSPQRLKTQYLNMTNPAEITLGSPVTTPVLVAPLSGTAPVCIDSNNHFVNCP